MNQSIFIRDVSSEYAHVKQKPPQQVID